MKKSTTKPKLREPASQIARFNPLTVFTGAVPLDQFANKSLKIGYLATPFANLYTPQHILFNEPLDNGLQRAGGGHSLCGSLW